MKTGKGQNRKTVLISTGDAALAIHYSGILEKDFEVSVSAIISDSLKQLTSTQPELLVLDPEHVDGDLNKTVADILVNNPGLRVILVEHTDGKKIDQHALFRTGVHGFCGNDISAALLCKAVQLVLAGEYWIQRKLITQVISELAQDADTIVSTPDGPDDSLVSTLTPRELQVARMVHLGGNNKMIARELDISERTVKAHLSAIFRKLDIENRLHLALFFSGRT
jgi:DNA-binding NarL/FixJ family response regulator